MKFSRFILFFICISFCANKKTCGLSFNPPKTSFKTYFDLLPRDIISLYFKTCTGFDFALKKTSIKTGAQYRYSTVSYLANCNDPHLALAIYFLYRKKKPEALKVLHNLINRTAHCGYEESLSYILKEKGIISFDTAYPLYYAGKSGDLKCFKLLLADPRINPNEEKVIKLICTQANSFFFEALLAHAKFKQIIENRPLSLYILHLNPCPRFLLQHPFLNINAADSEGNTALHYLAIDRWLAPVLEPVLSRADTNINCANHSGITPLMSACAEEFQEAHPNFLTSLLAHPTLQINQTDNNGWTALHFAVASDKIKNAQQLLRHKDILTDIQSHCGQIPYDLAKSASMQQLLAAQPTQPPIHIVSF